MDNYNDQLDELSQTSPRIAVALRQARRNRIASLNLLRQEQLLEGLDQFVEWLHITAALAVEVEPISLAAPLIHRAIADYETSVEAALSGLNSVVFDLMRDVLEIEHLLVDFTADPGNIFQWANADERVRLSAFSPNALRQRRAKRLGIEPSELPTTSAYRGHSQSLHVRLDPHPLGPRGVSLERSASEMQPLFREIYEHAGDLIATVHTFITSGLSMQMRDLDLTRDPDYSQIHSMISLRERFVSLTIEGSLPVFMKVLQELERKRRSSAEATGQVPDAP